MFNPHPLILVIIVVVALAGIIAFLLLKSRYIRAQLLRQVDREMNRKAAVNAKHTRAARDDSDFDESLLFALASGYDDLTIGLNKIENARNRIANRRKGK